MAIFKDYSEYYDFLYEDKPYNEEINYIVENLSRFHSNASELKTVLDLGCGTGVHSKLLCQKVNCKIDAIDISEEMIKIAENDYIGSAINFHKSRISDFRSENRYDVIISLFHVLSYHTTNEMVDAFFETIDYHLKDNGVVFVDCWYGPAVLNIKPSNREKIVQKDNLVLTRNAKSDLIADKNIVEVNYSILVENKMNNTSESFSEKHVMRYFFSPEIERILDSFDMEIIHSEEWLTHKPLSENVWNSLFIIKRR